MNRMISGSASILAVQQQTAGRPVSNKTQESGFRETLQKTVDSTGELKFSKHAVKRLDDRHIELSESQNKRLSEGVAKAEQKGINDSLVMLDSLAFIVNVPSQTVVTALDEQEAQDHIYTNIDGAVIA